MLERLVPDEYVASVFDIDLEGLKKRGIEGLIIDIDNTLVSWETKTADHRILEWFTKLERMGFRICLLSNNTKDRVVKFTEAIRIPAVYRAAKPRKRAFVKAMAAMGKTPSTTAVIGDQVFTDILGAKRLGLYAVLVMPVSGREFFTTRFVRKIERMLLARMVKEGKLVKPVGSRVI
ncbi:MAG: YqeG family HAD IIIA-type phosphatase [Clostridia bacterium]|jgi:HAD superfamily phosphatase (TIGR01668 family)|nr:YqeG family HAD IIIA-type phosphatase [Clostridiales bacterium]